MHQHCSVFSQLWYNIDNRETLMVSSDIIYLLYVLHFEKKFSLCSTSYYICINQPESLFLIFPSGGPCACMTCSSTNPHFYAWQRETHSSCYTTSILFSQTADSYFIRPLDLDFFSAFFFKLTKLLFHIWLIIFEVFSSFTKCWWKSTKEVDY